MRDLRAAALETLRPKTFFDFLRGTMRDLGLGGEEALGIGVYFVAVSSSQSYPLRLEIQEKTEGTAKYILQKVSNLLLPGSVITINADRDKDWAQFSAAHEQKIVFIPQWQQTREKGGYARLAIQQDRLIRAIGIEEEERVTENCEGVEAAFACISRDRFPEWKRRSRRLTMRQQEGTHHSPTNQRTLRSDDIQMWHQVQRLLKDRSRLPILFPDWEQIAIEQMCEADERAAVYVPTFLQAWRTMCLIRSFQSGEDQERRSMKADFLDLAAATLLSKALFREARWFPSPKNLFNRISEVGDQTGLLHPLTGKGVRYKH